LSSRNLSLDNWAKLTYKNLIKDDPDLRYYHLANFYKIIDQNK